MFRVGVRVEGCSGASPGAASTGSIAVRVRQAGQAGQSGRSLGQEVESQVTLVCFGDVYGGLVLTCVTFSDITSLMILGVGEG